MASAVQTGRRAEAAVAAHLVRQGCQLLARNFRGRRGEIDLVVRDGSVIAFVEVKARRTGAAASMEAVDVHKRRRMTAAAVEYIALRRLHGVAVRFDVAAVALDLRGRPTNLRYIRNAFSLPSQGGKM